MTVQIAATLGRDFGSSSAQVRRPAAKSAPAAETAPAAESRRNSRRGRASRGVVLSRGADCGAVWGACRCGSFVARFMDVASFLGKK
jgi:hypothetical protein